MAYNFNEIRLDKGMYSESGKSFEQVLETLDPNENYKGTPYEGLDAFQRQLSASVSRCAAREATLLRSSSPPPNRQCCFPNMSPAA